MKLLHLNRPQLQYSILSVFIFLSFALSCERNGIVDIDDDQAISSIESTSFQQSGIELYRATSGDKKDINFVISPLSIQLALYMVYNGADGETRKQIGDVLHVMDADLIELNKQVEELMDYYTGLVDEGHLDIYNAIFYDNHRIELAQKFVDRLKNYFDVHQSDLDFNSPSAVESINNWVSNKTYGKIKQVLENINDQEVLFLINALYLKADWVMGFREEATADREFTAPQDHNIMIPTMHRTMNVDNIHQDGIQVARLALADSALFVYLIMPDDPGQLSEIIKSKTVEGIWNNTLAFNNSHVVFEMPKIETKTSLSLNGALQSLGMTAAFDDRQADLHLIGQAKNGLPLILTRTLHDVYFKMDEKGVEGAAVTTIGFGTTSVPPSIQFNKPFLYIIADHELGLPLFIGQFTGIEPEK